MEDHVEKFRQADALAQNILRLTRNTLLVNLRFLDLALSQFQLTSYPGTLATDGQHLFYDTYYVLSMYKRERGRNVRDYLCVPAPVHQRQHRPSVLGPGLRHRGGKRH